MPITSACNRFFNGKWPVCYPPPVFKAGYVAQIGDIARQLLELVFQIPERIFAGDLQKMLQAQGLPQSRVEYFFCRPPRRANWGGLDYWRDPMQF